MTAPGSFDIKNYKSQKTIRQFFNKKKKKTEIAQVGITSKLNYIDDQAEY